MLLRPRLHLGVLVSGVVVEHHMNRLVGRYLALDRVEKADEFLMPMALHAAPDDLAFKDVEGSEQGGGAMALVVVGHRRAASLLHWQTRLSAVQRLDLALLVDAEHHRMGRWINVETDHRLELVGEFGELEGTHPVRLQTLPRP